MDRESPVPFWAVLTMGVVVLAGVYVFAQRFVAPPRPVARPTLVSSKPSGSDTATPTIAPSMTPAETPIATFLTDRSDLDLIYPDGNEMYRTDEAITIKYSISTDLRNKLGDKYAIELYLLNSDNVLIGYIGQVEASSSRFTWYPTELLHNGGLDMTSAPTPPGKYRILILTRENRSLNCPVCHGEIPMDTLDSPASKFKGSYILNTEGVGDKHYVPYMPLASDSSITSFELR